MKKNICQILNIIMGSSIGVLLGSGLYRYWHFHKYPDLYFIQSAPWYTGVLLHGFFTLIVIMLCLIIKAVLIENIGAAKKAALVLGIILLFLALIGGAYVIINHFLMKI